MKRSCLSFASVVFREGLVVVIVLSPRYGRKENERDRRLCRAQSDQLDVDCAQAACRPLDVEAHCLAFVQKLDLGRQFGAMHENVARAIVASKESETFGCVEEFNLARDAHVLTPYGLRGCLRTSAPLR